MTLVSTETPSRATPPRPLQAAAGLLAGACALAAAELVAGVTGSLGSPVAAVGGAVVDRTPVWLERFAISTFGQQDKAALQVGILVLTSAYACLVGVLAFRRMSLAMTAIAVFGALGAAAAVTRHQATWVDALPSLIGAAAGAASLQLIVRSSTSQTAVDASWDRRRFLLTSALLGAGAAVAAGLGRWLLGEQFDVSASRNRVRLPVPVSPAAPTPPTADLAVPDATPFITSNADFYRVDTALVMPGVPTEDWSLRVHGMVDRELTIDFADLLGRPMVERYITLACVSNEVGGSLVGNARWLGAPLRDVLESAGVHDGADQLVSRSADGWTAGTPVSVVMDGRDALLAVGMNGEPLPQSHGFPVRMVVPGLYGYVSATKWLVDLELSTFDAFDAYWVRRGWAEQGPIKTMARIDTPRASGTPKAGQVMVAGTAWAPHLGIDAVQVRVDDGPWTAASLATDVSVDTWRLWTFDWAATPGSHTLQARATDGNGDVQTGRREEPFPDGASGWHTVVVTVSD